MMRSLTLALVALAVANVMALPLAGLSRNARQHGVLAAPGRMLMQTTLALTGDEAPNAMFDDNDDDATVMAEMSKVRVR